MKYVLALLFCFSFSAAYASANYPCGPFKRADGQSILDLSANVVEDSEGTLALEIGKKFGMASSYEMIRTNKGPIFNLYTYKAGPYKVLYYQDKDRFVVIKEEFSAACKIAKK